MIRRGAGIGDHKEGKQQQATGAEGMNKMIYRPAQHIHLSPIKKRNKRNEECKAHIQLLYPCNDDHTQRHHEEKDDGIAAPLARGKPRCVGQCNGCHNTKSRGIKNMLAVITENIFGGNREESSQQAHCPEICFKQKAQAGSGNQYAKPPKPETFAAHERQGLFLFEAFENVIKKQAAANGDKIM